MTAFQGQAAVGGFLGAGIMMAIQEGVSKGVFSNEAGLGSSPIAAASARTDHPKTQALVAMTGTFFTIIITCLTGIVIAVTGLLGTYKGGVLLQGAPLTIEAFSSNIPQGVLVLSVALILFASSTILGWAFYGEKCFEYLFGSRFIKYYRILFTLLIIPGAAMSLKVVWCLAGIMNGLMAIPNLIGILGLSKVIVRLSKHRT